MDWTMRAPRIRIPPPSTENISILSFLFMFFWFSLRKVDATAVHSILRAGALTQAVGEAEVYIRLFPSHHKKLFFSIIIQGSLFINIFYKTNINFTSPAAGSMTRGDWKCLTFNAKLKTHWHRGFVLPTEFKVSNHKDPLIMRTWLTSSINLSSFTTSNGGCKSTSESLSLKLTG